MTLSKKIVFTALSSAYKAEVLKQFIERALGISRKQDFTAYAYWSDDTAVSLAILKSYFTNMKSVCRAHRWDVYFNEKKNEYLPYRRLLAENTDRIFFISKHAKKFFIDKVKLVGANSLAVSKLGTVGIVKSKTRIRANVFTIVSCSSLIPRKRVLLLAQSLFIISSRTKVKWIHFGDGIVMPELVKYVDEKFLKDSLTQVTLEGAVTNQHIREFYAKNHVDLFINVSESEGVPVSIMEAMSAYIPVIATNVDAVNEIVRDNFNGTLLPANPTAQQVADAIMKYVEMGEEEAQKYRQNSFEFWNENYNAEKNYSAFVNELLSL